jgi:hypothetical protein
MLRSTSIRAAYPVAHTSVQARPRECARVGCAGCNVLNTAASICSVLQQPPAALPPSPCCLLNSSGMALPGCLTAAAAAAQPDAEPELGVPCAADTLQCLHAAGAGQQDTQQLLLAARQLGSVRSGAAGQSCTVMRLALRTRDAVLSRGRRSAADLLRAAVGSELVCNCGLLAAEEGASTAGAGHPP